MEVEWRKDSFRQREIQEQGPAGGRTQRWHGAGGRAMGREGGVEDKARFLAGT